MEQLINYYSNLISTKHLQETIATDLRDITSDWRIKYEEEEIIEIEQQIETTNEDNDLDFYNKIDELLAKANESIKKDTTTKEPLKKSSLSIQKEEPKSRVQTASLQPNFKKCKSSFTLNKTKPVIPQSGAYLKAPYKTNTIKPVAKQPIQTIAKKCQSIDNLSNVNTKKSISETNQATSFNKITTIEKKLVSKIKSVSFKEMAMNLYLPPKLEYLTVKSTETSLRILKKKRKTSAKQSFLNKLTDNFCTEDEPSLFKTEIIYKKTKDSLLTNLFQIEQNNEMICYLKLKILIAYYENFNEKIKATIPKEILSLDIDKSNCLEISLFQLNKQNCLPITYENDAQLIRLNSLQCDLSEIEFKILLFNYLKENLMLRNDKNIEFLKLFYSFISNKQVIIAN